MAFPLADMMMDVGERGRLLAMLRGYWERCAQGRRDALWPVTEIYGRGFDLG